MPLGSSVLGKWELVRVTAGKLAINDNLKMKIYKSDGQELSVVSVIGPRFDISLQVFRLLAVKLFGKDDCYFKRLDFNPNNDTKSIYVYSEFCEQIKKMITLFLVTGYGNSSKQEDARLFSIIKNLSSSIIYVGLTMNDLYDLEFFISYDHMTWKDCNRKYDRQLTILSLRGNMLKKEQKGKLLSVIDPYMTSQVDSEVHEIYATIQDHYVNLLIYCPLVADDMGQFLVERISALNSFHKSQYEEVLKECSKIYYDESLLFPQRMSKANALLTLEESKKKALDKYQLGMKRFLQGGLNETIEQYHEVLLSEAKDELLFSSARSFCSVHDMAWVMKELEADIDNLHFKKDIRICGVRKDKFIDSMSTVARIIITSSLVCWQTGTFTPYAFLHPLFELVSHVASRIVLYCIDTKTKKQQKAKERNLDMDMFQVVIEKNPTPKSATGQENLTSQPSQLISSQSQK